MVTAELAVGLLALVALSVTLVWMIGLAGTQSRCSDAAVAVARQLARGDEDAARRVLADAIPSATMEIGYTDGQVHVEVSVAARFADLPPVTISGHASAPIEPAALTAGTP